MLNIFKLTDAISESAVGTTNIASIQPYEFIGSMAECTAEFNYEVMSEAASFMEFYANSEEIMTEAAVMNPDALDLLTESVFSKIKEHVMKFIDKIIAMVKGMVEKLKAFFFKLTGKTDKWLSIMKPKIKEAQGRRGSGDVTFEMHEWNVDYVNSGLQSGISSLAEKAVKDALPNASDVDKAISYKANRVKSVASNYAQSADDNAESEQSKAALKSLDTAIDYINNSIEEYREKFPATLAAAVGVSENSSLDAVWKAVNEKATGGEKKTVQIGNQVDRMVTGVEGSKKCIDSLKKVYEKHVKDLSNYRKQVENTFKKIEVFDKDDTTAQAVKSSVSTYLNAYSKKIVNILQMNETACSNAQGMNTSFVQTMTTEYMNALTRFAGYKEKKD